jgi:APA family basic amino acid/polyamine antiporter
MGEPVDSPNTALQREIGLLDATMIVVGSMIGSGIFLTSAESSRIIGSPGWLLVAWGLAGLLTVTGALCCAELSAMMPKAGGQYVFLREAYGEMVGFLFGWSMFLVVQTGTIAAVAVAFSKFLGVLAPGVSGDNYLFEPYRLGRHYAVSLSTQQLSSILVIVLLTAVNTRGLKVGTTVQTFLTLIKTAALFGLIAVGLTLGWNRGAAAWTSSWWNPAAQGWSVETAAPGWTLGAGFAFVLLLGKAMIGPLFSQTAWNSVTFTGGETRDPGRTLPRALLLGCISVVVLYLLANLAYLVTLPFDAIQHADQDRVGTAMMEAAFDRVGYGSAGLYAMAIAIMISTFGCDNGLILSGARVYYAMARDGLFFAKVATTNRKHVPAAALVAQGVWACLLTLPRTVKDVPGKAPEIGNVYTQLLEYIVSADLMFYALMVGAVVILRHRKPDAERPYRTFAYPLPPVIYLTLTTLLLADLVVLSPTTSGMGFAIVLLGIPVYGLTRLSKTRSIPS